MVISEDGFWARLYRFSRFRMRDWRGKRHESHTGNTNLCFFMRSIFVWMPLAAILNLAVVLFALYATYTFIIEILNNFGDAGLWFKIALLVGVSLGILIGAIYLVAWIAVYEPFRRLSRSETGQVLGGWLESTHDAICPLVTISPLTLPPSTKE